MTGYLVLATFGAVGFVVWIAVVKLFELYENRTPPNVQARVYTTAKNLPRYVVDFLLSCLLWCALGAMLIGFVLRLVGLDAYLPSTSWAPSVVGFFIVVALLAFWSSPARTEPIQPRGRGLTREMKNRGRLSADRKKTPTQNTRGRTIRSYHDIG